MRDEPEKQVYYYQWGEDYFFLAGRYDTVFFVAEPYLKEALKYQGARLRLLDAGCGPGNLISRIKQFGSVFGADCSKEALEFCRSKHGNPVFSSEADRFSLHDESFDFVFALELLEHVKEDEKAFGELWRVLKPGGMFFMTVPAFPCLWSRHDEWFGHFRRYRRSELKEKILRAGFQILQCSYYNNHLFIPMFLLRSFKKWFGLYRGEKQDDFYSVPNWLNAVLKFFIRTEIRLGLYRKIPFGTNLVCALKKPARG